MSKKKNWNNKYKGSSELPDMSYEFLGDVPYTIENMKEITNYACTCIVSDYVCMRIE